MSLEAATYYVATNGNDNVSCTQAQNVATPKATVANLRDNCVAAGDTIEVRGGIYTSPIYWDRGPNGTAARPITIKNYRDEQVIIRPTHPEDNAAYIAWRSFITLDGLIFDGSLHGPYSAVQIGNGSSNIQITNCEIRNAQASGILIQWIEVQGSTPPSFITLSNCRVYNNGHTNPWDHGIYVGYANNVIIERNLVHDNSGTGITVGDEGKGIASDVTTRYNIVRNNGRVNQLAFGGRWQGSGIYDFGVINHLIHNNLVYDNAGSTADGSAGLFLAGASVVNAYNNTFHGNVYGIFVNGGSAATQNLTSNIAFGNRAGEIFINQGGATQTNNFTSDPSFVDASNKNFTLAPSSPAIGTGYTSGNSQYPPTAPINLQIIP